MGMFGAKAAKAVADFDPSALTPQQKMMLFGATLRDTGAALRGGESDAVLNTQSIMAAQAEKAKHDAFLKQVMGAMSPTYADGPAPTVATPGLIGGQAAQAAAAPVGDLSSAVSEATSAMAPGPAPQGPAPYQYQPPQRTSNGLSIDDPRMGALTLGANDAGVNMKDLLEVLKAQQPSMMNAQDGTVINSKNRAWEGRQFPKLDNGIISQRGPNGEILGASALPGYADAAASIAGATTQAQEAAKAGFVYPNARAQSRGSAEGSAPYDFINAPGPNGEPNVVAKSVAVGGAFTGQSPADAAYKANNAKAASEQFQGLQTAALKAPALITKYQRLGELLSGYEGGKLSPMEKDLASLGNSIGFKLDPKLPNKEAAAAITNELALSLRDPSNGGGMPGAMSDADRNFLVQSVPGLIQTAAGRASMVQAQVKVLQRQQDVGAKARQWQDRFGRIDAPDGHGKHFQDYLDAYAAAHPLFAHK